MHTKITQLKISRTNKPTSVTLYVGNKAEAIEDTKEVLYKNMTVLLIMVQCNDSF